MGDLFFGLTKWFRSRRLRALKATAAARETPLAARLNAIQELGREKDVTAMPVLMDLVDGKPFGLWLSETQFDSLRDAVVEAIRAIADRSSVPLLVARWEPRASQVLGDRFRQWLIEAANAASPGEVAGLLVPYLFHAHLPVRRKAAAALNGLWWTPTTPDEKVAFAVGLDRYEDAALHGSRAVGPLGEALHHPDTILTDRVAEEARLEAVARALGRTGSPAAFEPLLVFLRGRGARRAFAPAIESLVKVGGPRAAGALAELLELMAHQGAPGAAESTAGALARTGDSRGIAFLIEIIQTRDQDSVEAAIDQLARVLRETAAAMPLEALRSIATLRREFFEKGRMEPVFDELTGGYKFDEQGERVLQYEAGEAVEPPGLTEVREAAQREISRRKA